MHCIDDIFELLSDETRRPCSILQNCHWVGCSCEPFEKSIPNTKFSATLNERLHNTRFAPDRGIDRDRSHAGELRNIFNSGMRIPTFCE